jgi:hypothetical protein
VLYSKFGSKLTPISKSEDASGRLLVQATTEGSADVREYQITDLKADDGSSEINQTVAALPLKVVVRNPSLGNRTAGSPLANRQGSRFRPKQH